MTQTAHAPVAPPIREPYFTAKGSAVTIISFAISLVALQLIFSWTLSLLILVQLLIHETGHAVAVQRLSLKTGMPVFIPFLGAVIDLKEQPRSAHQEAIVGIAGPVAGTVAALAVLASYMATGNHDLLIAAYVGAFINYFNLLPLSPLDGGRIVGVIHPALWVIGLVMAFALALQFVFMALLMVIFIPELMARVRHVRQDPSYYRASARTRLAWFACYAGLTTLLFALTSYTYTPVL